jgi:hypothetical protein
MAYTPYTGATDTISNIGTTPEERGLTTAQFKAKFDEDFANFVAWWNATHLGEALTAENALKASLPNRNLLHNWDLRKPVNQRTQGSYSASG